VKKKCVICGKWFPTNRPTRLTCSVACRKERQKRYDKQRHRSIQLQINAKRPKKKCVICGKIFPLKHRKSKACSVVCRKELIKEHRKRYYIRRNPHKKRGCRKRCIICGKWLPFTHYNLKTCSEVCKKERVNQNAKQHYLNIMQDAFRREKKRARVMERIKIRRATDPEYRKRINYCVRKYVAERKKDPKYLATRRAYDRKYRIKRKKNPEYLSKIGERRAYGRLHGRLKCVSDNLVRCVASIQAVASTIGKVLSSTKGGENVRSRKKPRK